MRTIASVRPRHLARGGAAPRRRAVGRAAALLAGGLLACSGEPGEPRACRGDRTPTIPDPGAEASLVGTVTVYEEVARGPGPDAGAEASEVTTGYVTASFADRSVRRAGDTPAFAFGEGCAPGTDPALCTCLGIIGRPVVHRDAMPLEVERAVAEGLAGGSLELTGRSAGHYMGGPVEAVFGAESVSVRAEGEPPAGVVLERAAGSWRRGALGRRRLWDGWTSPEGDRFVVGAGGFAAVDRGGGLEPVETGVSADLTAVRGLSAGDLFAVGAAGTALRWDGSAWTVEETGTALRLEALVVLGDEVLAFGEQGLCLRRDRSGLWSEVETGTSRDIYAVAPLGPRSAVAVGGQGLVIEWTGAGFEPRESGVGLDLLGVHVEDSGAVTAVGRAGMIVRDEGAGFAVEPSGLDRDLHAVSGEGAGLLAVGASGVVLGRWEDGTWALELEARGEDLHGVAVDAAGDVLVTGFSATFPPFEIGGEAPARLGEVALEGAAGLGDLVVRWEGSGRGYVDLTLVTEAEDDPSLRNRLRCIVTDDGCHRITREAVDWLVSGTARTASARVERHELVLATVDDQTSVVLDLVRAVSFTTPL